MAPEESAVRPLYARAPGLSDLSSFREANETSSTAVWNAASLALDGALYPLTLRTNCSAAA